MEKYKVIHSRVGLVVDPVIQNVGRLEFEDEFRVAELRTPTLPPWESSRWCRQLLDVKLVLDILDIWTFEAVHLDLDFWTYEAYWTSGHLDFWTFDSGHTGHLVQCEMGFSFVHTGLMCPTFPHLWQVVDRWTHWEFFGCIS